MRARCARPLQARLPKRPPLRPLPLQRRTSDELYIFVSAMGNLEYFNALKYGWKWAGDALGVKAEYVGPAEIDANAEAAALDQAIARKPAGIAVFAWDPVLQPGIDKAIEAGIPVVTICGNSPTSKRTRLHRFLARAAGLHRWHGMWLRPSVARAR